MTYVFLLVSCVVFIELFIFFDLKAEGRALITRSREALNVLTSPELDDEAKEAFTRRASLAMLGTTLKFSAKLLSIILILYALYWAVTAAFPELREPVLASMVSPAVIIGLTLAAVGYAWARNVLLKQL